MSNDKYRLITRSDFDGLVCAVLLREMNLIDEIKFVHPKDMQDGKIDITDRDITTNLPYVKGVHLAFDHHASEMYRVDGEPGNLVIDPEAPSAARVVYDYYGGHLEFTNISSDMMNAVDKADSAQFEMDEVLNPDGWTLLNFLMDARTGLGRFRDFLISNYDLMMELIDYCRSHTIEEILALPHVKERVDLYKEMEPKFREQLQRCSEMRGNLVVVDLRNEESIWPGNRFMVYALYPQANISMHVLWGLQKQNTVCAVGKSIFDRSSRTNVGKLMLAYGGGGHEAAGTCQVANDKAHLVISELIEHINADG
ncbi:MAG: exopolyphosphatase [Rhodospirillales bacterium]|nr:exopolyphosphatase [Rhodospirillales bacterium]MCW8862208.1 exopolyphosphatase [Rhodospirillales bacterium]MCW8952147.1 exopolyphosphatase [Rhodospirillales bacterium]MCW8970089.1 exopolyphosphatase [Rhodospirillales bacterium]MCW9002588.1 exopolyphosphatase [Rhodospirillales bacterium]